MDCSRETTQGIFLAACSLSKPCIKEANCHPIHFRMPFILQREKSHIKQKSHNTKILQIEVHFVLLLLLV